jgi:peroxiredoxin
MKRILILTIFIVISFAQEIAPTFFLRDVNGENFFASNIYGENAKDPKTTVISFSASWCGACQNEIKALDSLAIKFPDIKFFLIDYKENEMNVKKWISKIKTKIPVLLDIYGLTAKKFGVEKKDENGKLKTNLPTLFIINKKGEIIYQHTGYKDEDAITLSEKLKSEKV